MKFRVYIRIYPHQMDNPAQFPPFVSATHPGLPDDGSKLLSFDAEIPNDLFGVKQVEATLVEEQNAA